MAFNISNVNPSSESGVKGKQRSNEESRKKMHGIGAFQIVRVSCECFILWMAFEDSSFVICAVYTFFFQLSKVFFCSMMYSKSFLSTSRCSRPIMDEWRKIYVTINLYKIILHYTYVTFITSGLCSYRGYTCLMNCSFCISGFVK